MYLLNYLYFLIITYYGIRFLFQPTGIMKSPLNKEQNMLLEGPEMFWILTFSTGLLAFSAPGALDLMAVRLLVLEILCFIGLFVAKKHAVWTLPFILYVIYLIWITIGIFYSPAPGYGFRVLLKYCYPLLLALFASSVVRDKEVFLKAGIGARWVATISFLVGIFPFIESLFFWGVFWYGTARAINYISICIFSLALFFYTNEKKKNFLFFFLFMLPCILWVFRTSIMGTIVAISTFFFFKYKLKSLPIIFGIFILSVIAVFTIPSLKEKMFKKNADVSIEQFQEGEVSTDNINSNARFAMWEHLMDKFYYNGKETIGSGTGSVQNYMYNNFIYGGLKVPHSDFVQMLCDNGTVGLTLYLLTLFMAVIHSFIVFTRTRETALKICAITAGSAMTGVLFTLYSDNVVNYSMATLSMPFGFYGMMLGLQKKKIYDFCHYSPL